MRPIQIDIRLEKEKNRLQERIERIKANENRFLEADKTLITQHLSLFEKSIDRAKEFSLLFLRTLIYVNFGTVTAIATAVVAYIARVSDIRWGLLQLLVVPVVFFVVGGLLALACTVATWANFNAWAISYSRWDQYYLFLLKRYDANISPLEYDRVQSTFRGAILLGALSILAFLIGALRLMQIALHLK